MCGLIACFSKQKSFGFTYKDEQIIKQLLIADVFRGVDSTGVFGVNTYGNVKMAKEASSSPYFISRPDIKAFCGDIVSKFHVVVGHNRKATMGGTSDETAHPWIHEHIILVHNGTLTNHRELADTVVDSHAICTSIATHGYKHTLKKINGAYALIWYDINEKKVYFCRNEDRPLYMAENEDRVWLASEEKMLDWILDRNDIKKYKISMVPVDAVFTFALESRKVTKEAKPKKDKPVQTQDYYKFQSNNLSVLADKQQTLSLAYSSQEYSDIANSYGIGDEILFSVDDFEYFGNTIRLTGTTMDEHKVGVYCWLTSETDASTLDAFINAKALSGIVSSVYLKQKSPMEVRVTLRDPKIENLLTSKNGIPITMDVFNEYGGCCFTCGREIKEEEIINTEIDLDKDGTVKYVCCDSCQSLIGDC